MTDTTPQQPALRIVRPEEVVSDDHLTIPLKRPILVEGTRYDFVKLRYPKKSDIREMQTDKNATNFEQMETLLWRICETPTLNKNTVGELSASDFAWIQQQLNESGYMGFKTGGAEEEGAYTPPPEEVDTGEEVAPGVQGLTVKLKRPLTFNGLRHTELKIRYPQVKDLRVMNSRKAQAQNEMERMGALLLRIGVVPPMSPELLDDLAQSDFINIQYRLNESGFLGLIQKMT